MLNKKELRDLIEIALLNIKLTGAVIEKDYYVTQVIHTLSNIQNEYFHLVFTGGTCLAKAHKIINRMSEDIDFKIQMKNINIFNRSQLAKELKNFRTQIKLILATPNFSIIEDEVSNEGKYQRITLQYPHIYPIHSTLRPHLLIELTLADAYLPVKNLSVKTIIEDSLKETTLFIPPQTPCVSIDETAIEKWTALTRRIAAIERGYYTDDKSLVRHIYDLNSIKEAGGINTNFFMLAKPIVNNDAKQFKNQHPEYFINPCSEIRNSLVLLKNQPIWKEHYQKFLSDMVYESSNTIDYETAVATINDISIKVIDLLSS